MSIHVLCVDPTVIHIVWLYHPMDALNLVSDLCWIENIFTHVICQSLCLMKVIQLSIPSQCSISLRSWTLFWLRMKYYLLQTKPAYQCPCSSIVLINFNLINIVYIDVKSIITHISWINPYWDYMMDHPLRSNGYTHASRKKCNFTAMIWLPMIIIM